jgi:heme exporter protein D
MTHLGYIVAAYLATAIVIAAMIAWTLIDLSRQKRKLDSLEAEGKRRLQEVRR